MCKLVREARSMRSNHSTWDPRRPLYEELKAPPVPRRHYHGGSDECYHGRHPPGRSDFFNYNFFRLVFLIKVTTRDLSSAV